MKMAPGRSSQRVESDSFEGLLLSLISITSIPRGIVNEPEGISITSDAGPRDRAFALEARVANAPSLTSDDATQTTAPHTQGVPHHM
jgi:hypothetical protein